MSFADSLKQLNELDPENIGSWPAFAKAFVVVILFVAAVGAGYYFHLSDLKKRYDRVQGEESTLKEQFRHKAFQAANLDAYKAQMVEMEKTFGALVKQLPSDTEVPGLLEDISRAGLGSGLYFNAIQLQPEKAQEFYIELPINISVRGNYHDLGNFVSSVASLPRIVTLHDFSIKPSADNAEILNMEIVAKTYRYHDKSEDASQ
ncbi:type 4a pilus biogenesis protein PilO [Spartinivicinus poritis]|uniref:Type 4a pilus biogenesis protein PilO n=1 Tax=Spartinivicinus poritis TaxID=2994640 RepID=A0ABT5U5Y1_9GAMM|nr:type 4a pilus biogenesis protein PilO [Spartinivicinus sp. A2-2]MDE1461769.1 type 4a pilus biogenesis protein PilO [Spartinivicinus sp. A2-2]